MLAPVRTAAPSDSVLVTLAEAKAHCRVDHDDEDTLITAFVKAATAHFDGYSGVLGRALLTQTWQQDFGGFTDGMRLAVGDLISVSSVTYYDTDNTQQTLSANVYAAHSDGIGPFLALKNGQSWPSVYTRKDAVRVTWTAGYGSAAANVPTPIRQAILLLVGHWYENREAVGSDMKEVPMAVNSLVLPFRRVSF